MMNKHLLLLLSSLSFLVNADDISGTYQGSWKSHQTSFKGNLALNVEQQNNDVSVDFNISGSPLFKSGKMSGQIDQHKTFTVARLEGDNMDVEAHINGSKITAKYHCKMLVCFGDHGSMNLLKQ